MNTYFISDLHLNPKQPKLALGFKDFLLRIDGDTEALYILGDFFDAWIGDDEDDPFYRDIEQQLKSFSSDSRKIFFMHGNRDFLTGSDFFHRTGLTFLAEPTPINCSGKKILLMHGDSLCIDDVEYMQFRKQVRNPEWQQQVLALPIEQRRVMAAQLRQQSQSMNSNKAEDIMDVSQAEVERIIADYKCDVLLHGHTHRPARHQLKNAERIVLGDWGTTGWCVQANSDDIELKEFVI